MFLLVENYQIDLSLWSLGIAREFLKKQDTSTSLVRPSSVLTRSLYEVFGVGLFAFLQRPILSNVWSSFHYCLLPRLVACREEIYLPFSGL